MSKPHATTLPFDLDRELQHQAAALRALAGDLVRDPHTADDLTQETLRQALARRDLHAGPLGGWLRVVLTNFARQLRRGERRRRAREASRSEAAPAPSAADVVLRRETLQAVTAAVAALEEPYQGTILQRYFEDLPPRAIAQRAGIGVATVKSRLQRGLALLRVQLAARLGEREWRPALATVFGLPFGAGASAAFGGTTGLGWGAVAAAAACALLVGGAFAFGWTDEPRLPDRTGASVAAVATAPSVAAQPPTERHLASPAPGPDGAGDAWLAHPYELAIEVLVLDPLGLPVAGHVVELAPPGAPLHAIVTGDDGVARLAWPSRRPHGEVVIEDEQQVLVRVAVAHGRTTRHTIGYLANRPSRRRSGAPLQDVPLVGRLFETTGDVPSPVRGVHPFARFEEASALVPVLAIDELIGTHADASVGDVPEAAPRDELVGLVCDASGLPAPGAAIALFAGGPRPVARTTGDRAGRFRFVDLSPGTFLLRAGGDARGLATCEVHVGRGSAPITVTLDPATCVPGRLLDHDGAPIDGALLTWHAADGAWWDAATTAANGAFAFANLPTAAGHLRVWSPDVRHRLPGRTEPTLLPGTALELRLAAPGGSELQLLPTLPAELAGERVVVRLWNTDLDVGCEAARDRHDASWRFPGLPAGRYRVQVFARGCGWHDAGTHWLDGTHDCDLGTIALPAPGTLQVGSFDREDAYEFELCRLRADCDLRLLLDPSALAAPVALPAGDYALLRRTADGALRARRFTVQSGATTNVTAPE